MFQTAKSNCFVVALVRWVAMMLLLTGSVPVIAQDRTLEEWQLLYDHLRVKIEQHYQEHPAGVTRFDHKPYIVALKVFANDRDRAFEAAQEAQASKDPQVKRFFNRFLDLVDRAQFCGNDRGQEDAYPLFYSVRRNRPCDWKDMCSRMEKWGKPIYNKARELKFDSNITREQMQPMLEASLQDLDEGYSLRGPGRESSIGWLYPNLEGKPDPQADTCLEWVEEVRELADYFQLRGEYDRATELMNRYLKDALCLLDNGHQWYLDLADKYELSDAKEHIDGFYAKLFGKVEVIKAGKREVADGAKVVVTDPHDGRTWMAIADADGDYEIPDALLHEKCSPFDIEASYEGMRTADSYEGSLSEPDPSAELEKNLLIEVFVPTGGEHTMRYQRTYATWNDTEQEEGEVVHEVTISFTVEEDVEPTVALTPEAIKRFGGIPESLKPDLEKLRKFSKLKPKDLQDPKKLGEVLKATRAMLASDHTWKPYRVISYSVTGENLYRKSKEHQEDIGLTVDSNTNVTGKVTEIDLQGRDLPFVVIKDPRYLWLKIDNNTGKVVDVKLPVFDTTVHWKGTELAKFAEYRGRQWQETDEIDDPDGYAQVPSQMKSAETISLTNGEIRGTAREQKKDKSEGYKSTTVESSEWKVFLK